MPRPATRLRLTSLEDRLTPAGGLDSAFGNGGIVTTAPSGYGTQPSVVAQPDGHLLIVSPSASLGTPGTSLTRYNADGSLDTTFGVNGVVAAPGGVNFALPSVTVQPDGKIVLAGGAASVSPGTPTPWMRTVTVVRLNADGTPDATFGTNGVVELGIESPYQSHGVAVLAGGSIVVTGTVPTAGDPNVAHGDSFTYTVLSSAGVAGATTTFAGPPSYAMGPLNRAVSAVPTPDGGALLLYTLSGFGPAGPPQTTVALVKLTAAGTTDAAFDGDGLWSEVLGNGNGQGLSLAVQPDGKALLTSIASTVNPNGVTFQDVAVLRLNADGSRDTSFGGDGEVTAIPNGGYAGYASVALLPDGRVVVGSGRVVTNDAGVAVLNPDGTPDDYFPDGSGLGGIRYGTGSTSLGGVTVSGDRVVVLATVGTVNAFDISGSYLGLAVLTEGPTALTKPPVVIVDPPLPPPPEPGGGVFVPFLPPLPPPEPGTPESGPQSSSGEFTGDQLPPPAQRNVAARLDPAFGTRGLIDLSADPASAYPQVIKVIGLPGGGSLVVGSLNRVFVEKFRADGTPDPTYGTNGRAFVTGPAATNPFVVGGPIIDAALTADGGVVLVSASNSYLPDGYFGTLIVSKLKADGTPDAAFMAAANATGGFAPNPDGNGSDTPTALVALPGGGLLIVGNTGGGYSPYGPAPTSRAAVLRLRADGTVDTSFGNNGRAVFGGESGFDLTSIAGTPYMKFTVSVGDATLDRLGRLVLTGTAGPARNSLFPSIDDRAFNENRAFVARLTADGRLDPTFAGDGVQQLTVPATPGETFVDAAGKWVGVAADGTVVVGLTTGPYFNSYLRVAHLSDAGQFDATFGEAGYAKLLDARPVADLAVAADGTAVAVTGSYRLVPGSTDFSDTVAPTVGVYRITPRGQILSAGDIAVDTPGETRTNAGYGGAVGIDADGRVTVAAQLTADTNGRLRVARLADRVGVHPPVVVVPPVFGTSPVLSVPGDLNGDGVADKVVTDGPRVSVVSGKDGSVLVKAFAPFEASYTGTLNAVFVDIDGDGKSELVVSPGQGGGPVVAVYNADGTERGRFWGIDDVNFRGGVNLATTFTGGVPALIVTAGEGGGPRVAVFDGTTLGAAPRRLVADFFAFEPGVRTGVVVADGLGTLVFGAMAGGGPRVRGLYTRNLAQAGAAGTLDGIPADDRPFDKFVGDPASRQGVTLAVRPSTAKPVGNSYYTQEVAATVGSAPPEVVLEFGLFITDTIDRSMFNVTA